MKNRVCIIVLCCLIVLGGWEHAVPVPTNEIFTYQGRLYDNGEPLDGTMDLKVWLWDGPDPNTAHEVAVVVIDEHPVTDGYLTLHLNLEQAPEWGVPELFDGSDRWLQFWIRSGGSDVNDPYEELYPLTKLEATPFAHLAYRLRTPAALRSGTTEPTLTLGNEDGPEVYFEDDAGQVQYSYDALTTIIHNFQMEVGRSFSVIVLEDQTETISRDKSVSVGRNAVTTINASETKDVQVSSQTTIGVNRTEIIGGSSTTTAGGNIQMAAGNAMTLLSTNPIRLQEGVFVTQEPNDLLKLDGAVIMQPQSQAPVATSGYGKVYVSGTDGKLYYIDTAGGVHDLTAVTAEQVSFAVKRSASYTWPASSTFETIDFTAGTSVWDNTGDGFSTKNGIFAAPTDGVYSFHGAIFFTGLNKGDLIAAAINAAGRRYRGDAKSTVGTDESVRADVTVYLQAGDVVALEGYVSAALLPTVFGAASSTEAFTHFNGARVD